MAKKKTGRSQPPARQSVRPQPAPLTDRERGVDSFNRNDYDAAIAAWTAAYRESPSPALARALAEAHFRRSCKNYRRNPPQAMDDLKAACTLVPDDPVYLYYRGLAHHRQSDYTSAIQCYRASIRHDPIKYARTAFHLCLALGESGQDPSADPTWDLLSAEQRRMLKPLDEAYAAALVELSKGNFEAAEPHLHKANASYRGFSHYYLGVALWRRGQTVEGLAHWLSALKIGFASPPLHQNLTVAYTMRALALLNSPSLLEMVRAAIKFSSEGQLLARLKQHAEFQDGNRAAQAGDWSRALTLWQSAARRDQKQPSPVPRELLANMALALERLERWEEAADTWRDFLRRRPRRGDNTWTNENLAQLWKHIDTLYARSGYFSKSVDVLRYAIKAQPDDLTLRMALVKRHLENQNWRSAKSIALSILQSKPKHAEASALYAQAIDMSGDLDLMIDAWEQVLATGDAAYAPLARQRLITQYMERGDFYFWVNDTESGIGDYAKALALAPDDTQLRVRYGAALVPTNAEGARAQFEKADLSNDEMALRILGAWHSAGLHAEAERWLKRIARVKKPGPALLAELGAALIENKPEIASDYFTRAVEGLRPGDADAPRLLTMVGVVYAEHNQPDAAYDYARRALKLDPNFGPAHFNIGLWDAAKGRRQAAVKAWERAQKWAWDQHRNDIFDGIEEAIHLLEERHVPTLNDILDTIDPDGQDDATRRLMGGFPQQGLQEFENF